MGAETRTITQNENAHIQEKSWDGNLNKADTRDIRNIMLMDNIEENSAMYIRNI